MTPNRFIFNDFLAKSLLTHDASIIFFRLLKLSLSKLSLSKLSLEQFIITNSKKMPIVVICSNFALRLIHLLCTERYFYHSY